MILFLCILGLTATIGVNGEFDGVAFTVSLASNLTVTKSRLPVPFDRVTTDHRANYVSDRFYCPQTGEYEFQMYSSTANDTRFYLSLFHNSNRVVSVWAHAHSGIASAGNAVILYLKVNDTVAVVPSYNIDTSVTGSPKKVYTTFTGIQLGAYAYGRRNELSAFSVVLTTHRNITGGSPVLYDTTLLDKGQGNSQHVYNQSTGTFVAPSGGIYVFHFFGLTQEGQILNQDLYHNDDYVCSIYGHDVNNSVDAGNTAILHLQPGDHVQIRARQGIINQLFGFPQAVFSSFSGYQLMHDDALDITDDGPKAYFSAGLTHQRTFRDGEKVVFDQVFTDHGTHNHYDHIHGEFTAPYSGTYEFNFHAVSQEGDPVLLELYHNYKYIDSLHSRVPHGYGSAGNAAVLELDVGDVVFVRSRGDNALYGAWGEICCTFSGVMLHSKYSYHGGIGAVG